MYAYANITYTRRCLGDHHPVTADAAPIIRKLMPGCQGQPHTTPDLLMMGTDFLSDVKHEPVIVGKKGSVLRQKTYLVCAKTNALAVDFLRTSDFSLIIEPGTA